MRIDHDTYEAYSNSRIIHGTNIEIDHSVYFKGDCDILAGVHMSGGKIQIDGNVNQWFGGQMKKGIIIINGNVEKMLPGFVLEESIYHPSIVDV